MKHVFKRYAIFPLTALGLLGTVRTASAQEMIDYFQPIPIDSPLTSDTWGASGVLPRDVNNGLESQSNEWHYWDGKIIRDDAGVYHLHASRWPKSEDFGQWGSSKAIHATSDSLLGPYEDHGEIYDQ